MCKKLVKIPNHLGKISENRRGGGFFLTRAVYGNSGRQRVNMID